MAEQIYTIPVNDAFDSGCECPVCAMNRELENNAIEYTMGPSYMEDDNRALTDKMGFCPHHTRLLYAQKNRLGLALMLKTHTDKTIKEMKELAAKGSAPKSSFFGKSQTEAPVVEYVKKLESTCFICDRMEQMFERYIDTIFHMWKKDPAFPEKFRSCKGFCTYHYGLLYEKSSGKLKGDALSSFIDALNKVYFDNMERVNEDISWFIDKFDYRYKNEPWKNSKDALPRGIIKTAHTIIDN